MWITALFNIFWEDTFIMHCCSSFSSLKAPLLLSVVHKDWPWWHKLNLLKDSYKIFHQLCAYILCSWLRKFNLFIYIIIIFWLFIVKTTCYMRCYRVVINMRCYRAVINKIIPNLTYSLHNYIIIGIHPELYAFKEDPSDMPVNDFFAWVFIL